MRDKKSRILNGVGSFSAKVVSVFLLAVPLALAQTATIRVDPSRVLNRVSPRMYGAFAEMMAEDVKWGLTAEMVHDRSFEECPDYLGLPADWHLEPDERNDNGGAIKFEQTTEEAYPKRNAATGAAEHSLRVTLAPKDISDDRLGFSQGRISVRAGETYVGYMWAKVPVQNGYSGEVTVALEEDHTDGETYAAASFRIDGGDWRKYSFHLLPKKTDRSAKLTFLFNGKGALYLDQISLEPSDAADGVRSDSAAMIAGLRPSFLRWPGGNVAQDYHWQWGIGPRELRPTWTNKAWSNAPEPGDFGTDEYLSLCTRLHMAPSITVNVDGAGATAEEAAAWVEYVNGAASSKYGAMRAANGHPAPYGVKQWELGNEIFGEWVRGSTDAETYARSAVRYAAAMRAVDPTIKLIAVGSADDWNAVVLKIAGSAIDYLAIHDYTSAKDNAAASDPRAQMIGRAAEFEASHRRTGELLEKLAPGRNIKLIVNEWNLFYPADTIQSMEGAVYASRMMNGFERDGEVVEANCISDLLNGWIGGVIQASRDRVYGTTQYYALLMYSDHLGAKRLSAEVTSPELQPGVKSLDSVVTGSEDGTVIFTKMSNADREHALKVSIELDKFHYAPEVEVILLRATSPRTRNHFESPDAIKPVRNTVHCSRVCNIVLPAEAVAVVSFHKS
jgi:alpha-L-arabinofuranosidase